MLVGKNPPPSINFPIFLIRFLLIILWYAGRPSGWFKCLMIDEGDLEQMSRRYRERVKSVLTKCPFDGRDFYVGQIRNLSALKKFSKKLVSASRADMGNECFEVLEIVFRDDAYTGTLGALDVLFAPDHIGCH